MLNEVTTMILIKLGWKDFSKKRKPSYRKVKGNHNLMDKVIPTRKRADLEKSIFDNDQRLGAECLETCTFGTAWGEILWD